MKIFFANTSLYKITNIAKLNFNKNSATKFASKPDAITFTSTPKLLSPQEGEIYATKYRNSTAGYRGEYKKDFNDDFVYTMTNSAFEFIKNHKNSKKTDLMWFAVPGIIYKT